MRRSGLRDTWFLASAVHSMLLYVIIERATVFLSVALRVAAQQHQKIKISAPCKPPCCLVSLLPSPGRDRVQHWVFTGRRANNKQSDTGVGLSRISRCQKNDCPRASNLDVCGLYFKTTWRRRLGRSKMNLSN